MSNPSQPMIQRWDVYNDYGWGMEYSKDGPYVLYVDHALAVEDLNSRLEKLVVELADGMEWTWTRAISCRDAADAILARMVDLGLIEGWQHPLTFGGTGYSVYRINGKLYGRTDEPCLPRKPK